jgi:signal transduction histidine kinase
MDAHGGRIALTNREGGGMVVTLWIPKTGDALQQASA